MKERAASSTPTSAPPRTASTSPNPRRDRLYVATGEPGVLQSIDTGAGRVVETIATGRGAHTLGFDAEREHVYAFLPGPHAAAVFAEAGSPSRGFALTPSSPRGRARA